MLLDIEKLPTAENAAIRLHPSDNIAVARVPVAEATELRVEGIAVTVRENIPAGHKIALREITRERSETARKYQFVDGPGEVGLIAPVTQPFCGYCSRIRLTADGKLRTCLFSEDDHDLKFLLRGGASDDDIADEIRCVVMEKEKGHRINESGFAPPSRTMVSIGG